MMGRIGRIGRTFRTPVETNLFGDLSENIVSGEDRDDREDREDSEDRGDIPTTSGTNNFGNLSET